jgi:hypothetical protein
MYVLPLTQQTLAVSSGTAKRSRQSFTLRHTPKASTTVKVGSTELQPSESKDVWSVVGEAAVVLRAAPAGGDAPNDGERLAVDVIARTPESSPSCPTLVKDRMCAAVSSAPFSSQIASLLETVRAEDIVEQPIYAPRRGKCAQGRVLHLGDDAHTDNGAIRTAPSECFVFCVAYVAVCACVNVCVRDVPVEKGDQHQTGVPLCTDRSWAQAAEDSWKVVNELHIDYIPASFEEFDRFKTRILIFVIHLYQLSTCRVACPSLLVYHVRLSFRTRPEVPSGELDLSTFMAGLRLDAPPTSARAGVIRGDDTNNNTADMSSRPIRMQGADANGSAKKQPDCRSCPLNSLHKSFPSW